MKKKIVRQKASMSTVCRCVSRHIALSENIIRPSMLSTGCMIKKGEAPLLVHGQMVVQPPEF